MLGILFIYFIGKYFYELAKDNQKNKWMFAILGVVVYYAGGFLLLTPVYLLVYLAFPELVENLSERNLGFLGIPFGIGACFLFYYLLKKQWSKGIKLPLEEIDDIGKAE